MKLQTIEGEATTLEVQEILRKKSDRPLLLPDKLDVKVQECIKELWRNGACVVVFGTRTKIAFSMAI